MMRGVLAVTIKYETDESFRVQEGNGQYALFGIDYTVKKISPIQANKTS